MDLNRILLNEAKKLTEASVAVIGKSVMGKELFLIRTGRGKKRLFLSAAHHANEWITALVLMRFAGETETNSFLSRLLSENELYILPLANPDGAALVRGELTSGAYYERAREIAEGYPEIPFPSGWKANILGYDLNLAYPAGFERAKKLKGEKGFDKPAPRDYPGKAPVSSPEAMAIYRLVCENSFDMLLSFHTQGKVIYYKYADCNPKNSTAIARKMEEASGYAMEITPAESGNAGLKDWFIKKYNRPGFTIEAGQGTSPLPIEDFDEIYGECFKIIASAMEWPLPSLRSFFCRNGR